jgi:hypothetical protein
MPKNTTDAREGLSQNDMGLHLPKGIERHACRQGIRAGMTGRASTLMRKP